MEKTRHSETSTPCYSADRTDTGRLHSPSADDGANIRTHRNCGGHPRANCNSDTNSHFGSHINSGADTDP